MTKHPHDFGPIPQFNNIPDALKTGAWCVWSAKPKANGKYDKIPSNGVEAISTKEVDKWLTFDQAKQLYLQGGFNGVGRLMQTDGLVGIDIDNTHDLPDEIKDLGATYAERSPSGTGLRLVYEVDTIPARDLSQPYEVYSGHTARFLTFTGDTLKGCGTILSLNGQLDRLVASHAPSEGNVEAHDDPFVGAEGYGAGRDEVIEVLRYVCADDEQTWINVGMALNNHFNGSEEGFTLWDQWSRTSEKYAENDGARETRRIWERLGKESDTKLSFATVCEYARAAGADLGAIAREHDPDNVAVLDAREQGEARFMSASDLLGQPSVPPSWLIKGMLEKDTLAMMYGASGSGKSYAAIRMAVSIAGGGDFHSHPCKPGVVVYMCGEGFRGVKDRLRAIAQEEGSEAMGQVYLTNRITDFSSAKDIKATVEELQAQGIEPDLIIIDTLARASGAFDENSTADMNNFVRACDYMRRKFGCSVMPIHHTGKTDKASARGSSVLRAAVDVELMVENVNGEGMTLTSTKMKDGEPFETLGFGFKRVNFGVFDEDGDELYSHVLEPSESVLEGAKKAVRLSDNQQRLVKAFDQLFEKDAMRVAAPLEFTQQMGMDAPTEGVLVEDLRDHFYRMTDAPQNTKKQQYNRCIASIQKAEILAVWDDVAVKL